MIIDRQFVKQLDFDYEGYISDIITKRRIRDWRADTPVFISAQTGKGKTTFVLENILPMLSEWGGKMLIVCSRQALKYQYKHDLARQVAPEMLENFTESGLEKQHSFGLVDVYSYQELDFKKDLESYSIVILDECHYFISDAIFNKSTYRVLHKILQTQKTARRIYMTATPDETFPELIAGERENLDKISLIKSMTGGVPYYSMGCCNKVIDEYLPHSIVYSFKRDYRYLVPFFFSSDERIIQLIQKTPPEEKTIIFVKNKNKGKELEKRFGGEAEYIDADLKLDEKKDELRSIVVKNTFDKKVLIVTKFLDVGVSLKDPKLKNIVIFTTNKTDVLQMIGRRRRLNKAEKIVLYLYVPKKDEIQKELKSLYYKRAEIVENIRSIGIDLKGRIDDIPFPVYIDNGRKDFNRFTLTAIDYLIEEKKNLLEYIHGKNEKDSIDNCIAGYYLKWLGMENEKIDNNRWIDKASDSTVTAIEMIIEPVLDKLLTDEEEWKKIKRELLTLYENHEGVKTRKERKEEGLGVANIRKFFEKTGAVYSVNKKKNGYIFERG